MINDAKHTELIERLNSLEYEVTLVKILHEKLLEEIRLQNALLRDVKADLKEDQDEADWWKKGNEPPV